LPGDDSDHGMDGMNALGEGFVDDGHVDKLGAVELSEFQSELAGITGGLVESLGPRN
jgi:hypothetical protein